MATRGPHRTLIQQSRRVSPSEKAAYHQVSGAGKSHTRRQFFGLSASDEAAIVDRVEQDLARRLKGR
jgi:phage gpG-like protein